MANKQKFEQIDSLTERWAAVLSLIQLIRDYQLKKEEIHKKVYNVFSMQSGGVQTHVHQQESLARAHAHPQRQQTIHLVSILIVFNQRQRTCQKRSK